jgi:hypothetical protein
MTLSEWLDAERGRPTLMAAHFNVSISAVTQWRTNGVPVDRMLDVRELTDGAISLDEMVSHIKPSSESAQAA